LWWEGECFSFLKKKTSLQQHLAYDMDCIVGPVGWCRSRLTCQASAFPVRVRVRKLLCRFSYSLCKIQWTRGTFARFSMLGRVLQSLCIKSSSEPFDAAVLEIWSSDRDLPPAGWGSVTDLKAESQTATQLFEKPPTRGCSQAMERIFLQRHALKTKTWLKKTSVGRGPVRTCSPGCHPSCRCRWGKSVWACWSGGTPLLTTRRWVSCSGVGIGQSSECLASWRLKGNWNNSGEREDERTEMDWNA